MRALALALAFGIGVQIGLFAVFFAMTWGTHG